MPRFVSSISTVKLKKIAQMCSRLGSKHALDPVFLQNRYKPNKTLQRYINSNCIFIPAAEYDGDPKWKLIRQSCLPAELIYDSIGTSLQEYDELKETTFDRKCGLPFPSMLRRNKLRDLEILNALPKSGVWEERRLAICTLPSLYLQLAKSRLSTLVVVTSLGGYAACPAPWQPTALVACLVGVYATAFSANTINQCLEVPFDAQMKRTQNRVLPRGALTSLHAATFGLLSGAIGVTILYLGANPLTAALGLSNILLYAAIYTPMKRMSVYNTWVGSLVGAVPPLMGWTACGGPLDSAGFVLAAVLFAWQFPHFNALSWNLRPDYTKAGYRMMAVCRPDLLKRTSLTYTAMLTPLCCLVAPYTGLTTWTFAATSMPLNFYFTLLAWRFYKNTDSKNSKKLFRCSLVYLPALITLMLLSKPTKKGTDS